MAEISELSEILARLEALERKLGTITPIVPADRAIEFDRLPANATVGKDYAAYRFGCSERAVVRREAGTHLIPRKSSKPLKFTKRDVDEAWAKYTRPARVTAAAAIAKANKRTRIKIAV